MTDKTSQLQLHLIEDSGDSSLAVVPSEKRETPDDSALLPYAPSKRKKIVLEEDEYVYALESIIERDFFPDSSKLKGHIELLDEYERGSSSETLRKIREKIIAEQRRFGATPNVHADDSTMFDPTDDSSQPPAIDPDLTVDRFFRLYNSEDNESFEKLHEKDLQERRERLHWMYESGDAGKSAGMLMWYHNGGKVLTAEEREHIDRLLEYPATLGDDRPNGPDSWRFRVRNQLMFPPELPASRDTCYLSAADDPAARARKRQLAVTGGASSSTQTTSQLLLIRGESDTSTKSIEDTPTSAPLMLEDGSGDSTKQREEGGEVLTTSSSSGRLVVVQQASAGGVDGKEEARPGGVDGSRSLSMPPPTAAPSTLSHRHVSSVQRDLERKYAGGEIQHRNTRLRGVFLQDRDGGGEKAPGGWMHTPSGASPVELPHTPSSYASSSYDSDADSGTAVSRRGGQGGAYRTVAMTPSPMPEALTGEGRLGAHSPLMTWGDICATPVALDAYTAAPSYRVLNGVGVSGSGGSADRGEGQGLWEEVARDMDTSAMSDTFRMSSLPQREQLAHRLDERARAKKRRQQEDQQQRAAREKNRLTAAARGSTPLSTPLGTPLGPLSSTSTVSASSGRKRAGTATTAPPRTPLTPAGMALAQKLAASSGRLGGGIFSAGGREGDRTGRGGSSSSSSRGGGRRGGKPSKQGGATHGTPQIAIPSSASRRSSSSSGSGTTSGNGDGHSKRNSSLTDGLLQI